MLRAGTLATMPRWMRSLGGLRQSRLVDVLVDSAASRDLLPVVHLSTRLELMLLRMLSPMTVPVVEPVLLGVPPTNPVTLTPTEARERLRRTTSPPRRTSRCAPSRPAKVFGEGGTPSDEGIIESQPILGSIA